MSRELQISNETFNYPEPGDNAGWGEDATDWAEAATNLLATLSGPNDIQVTTISVLDNQSSSQNVQSLIFNKNVVNSFEVTYFVTRTDGSSIYSERGKISGLYDGTDWDIQIENLDDAGMDYEINSSGQIKYYSSSIGGTYTGIMKFYAKTLDL